MKGTLNILCAGVGQGAVMFLFEGPFGRVLHCGDFRWEQEYQKENLHPILTSAPLDVLYLDNTYAHPRCALLDDAFR